MRSTTGCDSVTGQLGAVTGSVTALVEAVQAGALHAQGHDELSGVLAGVRSVQARLDYLTLSVVREVDSRGSFVADGALTAGAWARMHTRMTPGEAASAVRTARTLGSGQLPGTEAALAAGRIDLGHVQAITGAVAGAPAGAAALIEAEALAVAGEADPRAVAALMTRFRHALDPDAADAAALARYARRGLTLSPLPDGAVHVKGLADEVSGALLATAIDAANPPVSGDTRSAAQRRLDALTEICRKYLGSPDAPMSGGGHAHLIVTTDITTMTNGHPDTAEFSENHDSDGVNDSDRGTEHESESEPDGHVEPGSDLEGRDLGGGGGVLDWGLGLAGHGPPGDGTAISETAAAAYGAGPGGMLSWVGPIAGSTARRVGCDADVTFVGINEHGEATLLGREQRFFTWAQRKAMIARDGDRCAVPFCDRPIAWSDAHHLKDWFLGGPTTIGNGALPCAGHHPMCHEGGWALIRLPDGRYLFRHRDGKTIGPEPYPPGHSRPPPHHPQ